MQKENNLYKNILLGLANALKNDYVKAALFARGSFANPFIKQINALLTLEKKDHCNYNDQTFAVAIAQAISNFTKRHYTIEKSNDDSFNYLDNAYYDFVNFITAETSVSKASLKNPIDGLSPDYIKNLLQNFDTNSVNSILDQQKPNEPTPAARVVRDEAKNSNANANFGANQNNANAQFNKNANMGMFGFNPFMNTGQMGGDFPIHPRFDPRFFPFTKKLSWMQTFKYAIGGITVVACLFVFILTLVCQFKTVSAGNNPFLVWTSGPGKGGLAPFAPNEVLPIGTNVKLESVLFRLAPGGGGLVSGLFSIIPAFWIGYQMFMPPRMAAHKYYMSTLSLGINTVLVAFTLYYLASFLVPSSLGNGVKNSFYVPNPTSARNNEVDNLTNEIVKNIKSTAFYKSVYDLTIAATVFISINIISFIVAIIINPRIDREKIIKANNEYQKAVQAKFQNQEYQIDPSLYDEELGKEHEKMMSSRQGKSRGPSDANQNS